MKLKTKKTKTKKKNAFTLIELLAIIVIIAVLFGLATVVVNKIVTKSKRKAHFLSVASIVDTLELEDTEKLDDSEEENNYCIYNYTNSVDSETQGSIEKLYVLMYRDSANADKFKYAVYSTMNGEIIIDTANFNKEDVDDESKWKYTIDVSEYTEDSSEDQIMQLANDITDEKAASIMALKYLYKGIITSCVVRKAGSSNA